jgi:hypothetical protein
MRWSWKFLQALGFVAVASSAANAGTLTFTPSPSQDLFDLDHYSYYVWGIDYQIRPGSIQSATLTFHNIYDFMVEDNDTLFVHLFDAPLLDTNGPRLPNYRWDPTHSYMTMTSYGTDQTPANEWVSDQFAGQPLIGAWNDPVGGRPRNFDLTFEIPQAYFGMLTDGNIGFGIDPDCHYFNDGVTLTVETVPEPGTLLMLGSGVVGFVYRRRRKA